MKELFALILQFTQYLCKVMILLLYDIIYDKRGEHAQKFFHVYRNICSGAHLYHRDNIMDRLHLSHN